MKNFKWLLLGMFFLVNFGFTQEEALPPYKDVNLPVKARVTDLVSRMTLQEKVSQMVFDAPAIERLDIPEYNWWNECLHGVARAGIATVFPQAIGLAATWNTELMFQVATIISTEARAKHHEAVRQGDRGQYKGLTFWSPNINIFRDPRWGRGQETYGEDPYLTARMGVAFVKGLQGDDAKYLKVVATPKHYAVHSGPEPDRHHFDARVDERDLRETYLPAFKACIVEGKAYSVMGAYNRYNGESCCAHQQLLQKILRGEWGFSGYVVSDCGAIRDIFAHHQIVETPEEAVALAVKRGCDLNCGSQYPHLVQAVEQGLITEAEIDTAVTRLFTARMLLGMFDPPEMVAYARIPFTKNDCKEHSEMALKVTRESIVLLKNENNFLPLKKDLPTIAVVGPNADVVEVLLGNYEGTPSNPVTPLAGIRQKVSKKTKVLYEMGCNVADDAPILQPIPTTALSPLGGGKKETGLAAEFFENEELTGEPILKRIDKIIDFNWHNGSPAEEVAADHFSARWQGQLIPTVSGEFTLGVSGDDGYRLFINNELIIEHWSQHAIELRHTKYALETGKAYDLRLEFYEAAGGAAIQLLWATPNENAFEKAVEAAKSADVAIMVGGISPRLEGEEMKTDLPGFAGGDRTNLQLPAIQQKLLKALHQTGTPVVLVVLSGSALATNWAQENLPAIIAAWYPGQAAGTALADVLFGDYNPAGRLPVTFYKSVDQLPPFEDYHLVGRTYRYFEGEPLYPFGFGLSYTQFEYVNLKLSAQSIKTNESVTVAVDVKNVGQLAGDEVVQVYVSDKESSVPVPIKALKGFQRIHLKPGEKQTVTFQLDSEAFSLIDRQFQRVVEPGEFEIMVGWNSVAGLKGMLTIVK